MLVHGANLLQKEFHLSKYRDDESKQFLVEIRSKYDEWHNANLELVGPLSTPDVSDLEVIKLRVALFEEYKAFIDQQKYAEKFDSRSNLHSSVLEEFLYYLFRDLVTDFGNSALIGKSHAFKDVFFNAPNYKAMTQSCYARIETKDHDFVIGTTVDAYFELKTQSYDPSLGVQTPLVDEPESSSVQKVTFDIAAVAIECKTYLDKTMLEGSSRAAEELKFRNPNSMYIVVMEWLKLTEDVNLRKYKVDQIYVLRRQKNTDREFRYASTYVKNPVEPSVVVHLFISVRDHLTTDWHGGIQFGLERGWLI